MRNVGPKLAFVLAACNHGTMIVSRFNHRMTGPGQGVGIGFRLFEAGGYNLVEFELALQLIEQRRCFHGDRVVAIDCGAHIAVHAIEWDSHDLGLSDRDRDAGAPLLCASRQHCDQQLLQCHRYACPITRPRRASAASN
jgi:hypothetical protein